MKKKMRGRKIVLQIKVVEWSRVSEDIWGRYHNMIGQSSVCEQGSQWVRDRAVEGRQFLENQRCTNHSLQNNFPSFLHWGYIALLVLYTVDILSMGSAQYFDTNRGFRGFEMGIGEN